MVVSHCGADALIAAGVGANACFSSKTAFEKCAGFLLKNPSVIAVRDVKSRYETYGTAKRLRHC